MSFVGKQNLTLPMDCCERSIPSQLRLLYTGHLIGCGKLCGNFRQFYAEESDDYAEKTPDYAEISKINQVVPLAFSNV